MASVEVHDAHPETARRFLAGLETATGVPPVDEDEQRRLAGAPPLRDPGWDWTAHLVMAGDVPVAYAGIRTAPSSTSDDAAGAGGARVDLALDRDRTSVQTALSAALGHLRGHADPSRPAGPIEAWLRGARADDLATAAEEGFRLHRRLHVLGVTEQDWRTATAASGAGPMTQAGASPRSFDPSSPTDADAVVTLLARAYPGQAGRPGWDRARFAAVRDTAWFRPDDLLLLDAADPDAGVALAALHWMKRRGDGVGEVYNLAVDPAAQGHGFGPLLLDAGLAHLFAVGMREVVLWVDAANERALALYRSRGFTGRWDDVSLVG